MNFYNGPYYGDNILGAIDIDNNKNVYVTGHSQGSGQYYNDWDWITIKYDSLGTEQWSERYAGPYDDYEQPEAIDVNENGDIYIAGNTAHDSYYSGILSAWLVIKYNTFGVKLWARSYDYYRSEALDIVIDNNGDIIATGYKTRIDYNNRYIYNDFLTVKYSTNGNIIWEKVYSASNITTEAACAVAVDDQSNVYVTGYGNGTTGLDIVTIKYRCTGEMEWISRFNGLYNGDDRGYDIAVDIDGNVYVMGTSRNNVQRHVNLRGMRHVYLRIKRGISKKGCNKKGKGASSVFTLKKERKCPEKHLR